MLRTLWTFFAIWGVGECAPQQSDPWRPVVAVPEAAAVKGIGRNGERNYGLMIPIRSPNCDKNADSTH